MDKGKRETIRMNTKREKKSKEKDEEI